MSAGTVRFRLYCCGCNGVADWEVWLLLAGYGRGSTVNSDECPSYCDYPDIGVWAVWQIDLDTTWQESGALPWVVWVHHGQLGVFTSLPMQMCEQRPGGLQNPPEAAAMERLIHQPGASGTCQGWKTGKEPVGWGTLAAWVQAGKCVQRLCAVIRRWN